MSIGILYRMVAARTSKISSHPVEDGAVPRGWRGVVAQAGEPANERNFPELESDQRTGAARPAAARTLAVGVMPIAAASAGEPGFRRRSPLAGLPDLPLLRGWPCWQPRFRGVVLGSVTGV